jgi:DNA repair exonuclease SbcCD ATPase subunit
VTSFEPAIQKVAIEAFRGFRDRQEFDLTASVVVLAGPNGTGKTSFFDALQWCLLGSIQRLEGLRARRNVEHIVNQYRLSQRAFVEIDMVIRGRALTIRRSGDHTGSTLEFIEPGSNAIFGSDAEVALEHLLMPEGLTLEMALATSGLLQQEVMRAVLQAKPADRYRHISTVLGLGALEDFEEAVREGTWIKLW